MSYTVWQSGEREGAWGGCKQGQKSVKVIAICSTGSKTGFLEQTLNNILDNVTHYYCVLIIFSVTDGTGLVSLVLSVKGVEGGIGARA